MFQLTEGPLRAQQRDPSGNIRHVCISGVNNSDLFRRNKGLTVVKHDHFYSRRKEQLLFSDMNYNNADTFRMNL